MNCKKMSKTRIRSFFEIYSQNLSITRKNIIGVHFEPDLDNIFLCPMCLKYFTQDDIELAKLSLEHVPPRKLGGKVRTLTCKFCNNTSGSELESQLIKKLEFLGFWSGSSSVQSHDMTYRFNDGKPLPGTLNKLPNGNLEIIGHPHRTDPKEIEKASQAFQQTSQHSVNLKIEFTPYKELPAFAALLRIAYLYAFSILGYSLILPHAYLREFRRQFFHPDEKIIPQIGIFPDIHHILPDDAIGLNLIVEPQELQSFFVVFDLLSPKGIKARYGVCIPGPTKPGTDIYKYMEKHSGNTINQRMTHIFSDVDTYFEQYPFIALDIWNNWRQQK